MPSILHPVDGCSRPHETRSFTATPRWTRLSDVVRAAGDLFDIPATAGLHGYILAGFPAIGDSKGKRVPFDAMANTQGDVSQLIRLRERTGVPEMARRLLARFDGVAPVLVDFL